MCGVWILKGHMLIYNLKTLYIGRYIYIRVFAFTDWRLFVLCNGIMKLRECYHYLGLFSQGNIQFSSTCLFPWMFCYQPAVDNMGHVLSVLGNKGL